MNLFDRYKWLSWVVLLLLVVNIGALATIIYYTHFHRPGHRMEKRHEGPGVMMVKELRFDKAQESKFHALKGDFLSGSAAIFDTIRIKRAEMFSVLSGPSPDTMRLNILAAEIGRCHADLKKLAVRHYFEVRAICNPGQATKLTAYFRHFFMDSEEKSGRPPLHHREGR